MSGSTVNLKGWAAVVIAIAVAASLLAILVTTKPAEAAGRYKTVTKTFSNPSAISINDTSATPYPSQVAAGGMRRGKILDVNVTLRGFSHTFPGDVDVALVGPGGQNAIIMSDAGSILDVSNITLTLDDEATASLPDAGQLVSGPAKPANFNSLADPDTFTAPAPALSGAVALSTFDRTNPNGTWSLYVSDDYPSSDGGQFAEGWSMQIRARVLR